MAWKRITNAVMQFQDTDSVNYALAVLKFYESGTTTPITIAADDAGGTTASDAPLDSDGYVTIGGSKAIVHVQETYKMVMYPTQADADADSGALWTLDALDPGIDDNFTSITTEWVKASKYLSAGTKAPGTNGDNVVVMENGTEPTSAPADTVQMFSTDRTVGNTQLSIYTEGDPFPGDTDPTVTRSFATKVNGVQSYALHSDDANDNFTFKSPRERAVTVSSASGVLTLDLSEASSFFTTLTENITSIVFSNPPASGDVEYVELEVTQHASAAKTVAATDMYWNGGNNWVMTATTGAVDLVAFRSRTGFDAAANIVGVIVAQAIAA